VDLPARRFEEDPEDITGAFYDPELSSTHPGSYPKSYYVTVQSEKTNGANFIARLIFPINLPYECYDVGLLSLRRDKSVSKTVQEISNEMESFPGLQHPQVEHFDY